MPDKTFTDVYLSAEQVTETHRTLENDHTVTEVELPGMVNVYLHIDGGKLLFTQYKAGKVLDAIEQAAKAQSQNGQQGTEPAPAEPPAEAPPEPQA
jgi:hypothetical protein